MKSKFISLIALALVTGLGLLHARSNEKAPSFGSSDARLTLDPLVEKLSTSIADVVEKVGPTVVSIHSEKTVEVSSQMNPFDYFFGPPNGFMDPRRGYRKQQPRERKQEGMGSGVIISPEGYLLTNHHVAGDADTIFVTLKDKRRFEAEVVGSDEMSDVALLKLKGAPKDLPVAMLGSSDVLRVGEMVLAIGSPLGYPNTVTRGILSAKGRTTGLNLFENYLQTDAAINPGNSGGALLNMKGELIGINTAIASRSGGSQGIGFAIPIDMAMHLVRDLLEDGEVNRGFLGVMPQEVDDRLREHFGLDRVGGALITEVIAGTPAEEAGIQAGDIITSVGDEEIRDLNHFRNRVAMLTPGKEVKMILVREGKPLTVKVTLTQRDDGNIGNVRQGSTPHKMGVRVEPLTQESAQRFGLKSESGAVVVEVKPGSEADQAGLRIGDAILRINRQIINGPEDFKRAMKNTQGSTLVLIERQGQRLYTTMEF